eukprot:COSAG01_NODE_379_length_17872_cov_8.030102_16_plen_132_part_00
MLNTRIYHALPCCLVGALIVHPPPSSCRCAEIKRDVRPRDLWLANATYEGPAVGLVSEQQSCSIFGDGENHTFDLCDKAQDCPPYPGFPNAQNSGCTYVDETFSSFALATVSNATAGQPFFMFWAPHIVHR